MSWLEAKLKLSSDLAERYSEFFMEYGALSTSIEDAWAGTEKEEPLFGEPGEPTAGLWQESRLVVLFASDVDVPEAIAQAALLLNLPLPDYEIEPLAEQDWVRLTQSQFDPIQISNRLWITPSWHEVAHPEAVNLQLDPGLAFGTGSHPTTRLCLQWLDANIHKPWSVLDYGCGSGILAIAAKKLGAGSTVGVDIDEQAIRSSLDNAEKNGVAVDFYLPDQLPDGVFDLLVANILTNPLRLLGEMFAGRVKSGGTIVLSGILETQAEELLLFYSTWFKMETPVFDDGWTRLVGVRR
jgi:ribosomal protein L11 methyltransferase